MEFSTTDNGISLPLEISGVHNKELILGIILRENWSLGSRKKLWVDGMVIR